MRTLIPLSLPWTSIAEGGDELVDTEAGWQRNRVENGFLR